MSSDYWEECISEAFDDAGITATKEQIDNVAGWVEGAHEQYGMAHGHDCIPNPLTARNEQLARDLKVEQDKVKCEACNGSGYACGKIPKDVHNRIYYEDCWKCRGDGRISP